MLHALILTLAMQIVSIDQLASDPEIRKLYVQEKEVDAILNAHKSKPGEAVLIESDELRVDRILQNLGPQWTAIRTESKTVILRKSDEKKLRQLISTQQGSPTQSQTQ